MKIFKKIGGLLLLILIIGLILFVFKYLVDKTKKNILIENEIKTVPTSENKFYSLVKIIDGDTIEVKIDGKIESVRLIGINAPEKDECFSDEATEKIEKLIGNKEIRLEADESQNDRDKYDRLLRYVYVDDGTLVNKKMIEEGVAKEYTYKIPYKFQKEFKESQNWAKENKLGLWGKCE